MLSAVLFLSLKGDIIIQRYFRDDIPASAAESFRQQLIAGKFTLPIVQIDGVTFLYTRQNDVQLVVATRLNANAILSFEFLCSVINVCFLNQRVLKPRNFMFVFFLFGFYSFLSFIYSRFSLLILEHVSARKPFVITLFLSMSFLMK